MRNSQQQKSAKNGFSQKQVQAGRGKKEAFKLERGCRKCDKGEELIRALYDLVCVKL